ncbi:MAG: type II toxin-antitoxin system mRNA interferase toxin, RelE/StbE family [Candidatus Absconditabacteria bacterium]|nr:type II toxin-antitoxin system mRNA interferase toxin, RelE/StbE family [Candidatus Absconditabacteria bacterium]
MTWIIKRTNQFKKNYQKLPQHIQDKFKINFQKFLINPYDHQLKTHKLKGLLGGFTSSRINDDYRFITQIEEKEITLINIGNHGIYK